MYLELLEHTLTRFAVRCHAFCLMWNHIHLLLTPTTFPLSRMMQQLNSRYCRWFNKRHRRVGHMLQGRYAGLLIDGPVYFLNAFRYLALNPVVAGKVTHPADWPWSSYRATMGLAPLPSFLDLRDVCAAMDATDLAEARDRLDMFVMSGDPVGEFWGRLYVGSEGLQRRVGSLLEPHRANPEFAYADRFATRPALATLLEDATPGPTRDRAVHEAFLQHAYTLNEIGKAVGKHPTTVWRWVQRAHARR